MADFGEPLVQNMVRTEDDTNDIVLHVKKADGTDQDVVGWTAELSIGDASTFAPLAPPQVYAGLGSSGGLVSINMNGFNCPVGTYRYDIRVTDTVTGDSHARVYVKGKIKVTERIN